MRERRGLALALLALSAVVAVLCFPMVSGHFPAGAHGELARGTLPFRMFWADEVRRAGAIPQWNPFIFGGLPFIGAGHGDSFYPTALLRLVYSAAMAINVTIIIHLVLAGWFMYAFLRGLGVERIAAVAGGFAYQLSGMVVGLLVIGRDNQLMVAALLPLMLAGLTYAIREGRSWGYPLTAIAGGLTWLAGDSAAAIGARGAALLFALYLCVADDRRPRGKAAWKALGLALGALLLGTAMAAVQLVPMLQHNRLVTPSNPTPLSLVFHLPAASAGLATLALAVLAAVNPGRRHPAVGLLVVGAIFTLLAITGQVTFAKLWSGLAPHSPLFIAALALSALAAFGIEGLAGRLSRGGLVAAACAALIAAELGVRARSYFHWTTGAELYAGDEVTSHLARVPMPFRVLDVTDDEAGNGVYPGNFLMMKRIPNAVGRHGRELASWDALLGGKDSWSRPDTERRFALRSRERWDELALRFVIFPVPARVAGYHVVARAFPAATGGAESLLYEADSAPPYARVLSADGGPAGGARVSAWQPGAMTVDLETTRPGYLVVAESWHPGWRARIDGIAGDTVLSDRGLIAVPVRPETRKVDLTFKEPGYLAGKVVTAGASLVILLWLLIPAFRSWKRG